MQDPAEKHHKLMWVCGRRQARGRSSVTSLPMVQKKLTALAIDEKRFDECLWLSFINRALFPWFDLNGAPIAFYDHFRRKKLNSGHEVGVGFRFPPK